MFIILSLTKNYKLWKGLSYRWACFVSKKKVEVFWEEALDVCLLNLMYSDMSDQKWNIYMAILFVGSFQNNNENLSLSNIYNVNNCISCWNDLDLLTLFFRWDPGVEFQGVPHVSTHGLYQLWKGQPDRPSKLSGIFHQLERSVSSRRTARFQNLRMAVLLNVWLSLSQF